MNRKKLTPNESRRARRRFCSLLDTLIRGLPTGEECVFSPALAADKQMRWERDSRERLRELKALMLALGYINRKGHMIGRTKLSRRNNST